MERSFAVDAWEWRDDMRSVEGCIIPYGKVTTVTEPDANGALHTFREKFLPHSIMTQSEYAKRKGAVAGVWFLLEHNETNFDHKIGYVREFREADDGAYAVMRLYDDARISKVRSMLSESHTGLSVSFRDTASPKVLDGVVCRTQVYVDHVAATPVPAYDDARIMAIRESGAAVEDSDGYRHFPHLDELQEWLANMRKAPA